MKKHYLTFSLSGTLLLIVIDLISGRAPFSVWNISVNLLFGNTTMILCPCQPDKESDFLKYSLALLALCLVIALLPLKKLTPLFVFLTIAVNFFFALRRKFSKVKNLFKSDLVWSNVVDFSNMFISLLLVLSALLSFYGMIGSVVALALQCSLMYVSFRLKTKNVSFLLNDKNSRLIKSIANSNLRDPQDFDATADSRRMNALYKSAMDYMEKNQPYLDENFNLDGFATKLYTNKVYLSRTVNTLSGRNFRQFVNYYRVRYSTELFRKDPRLKVEELALMSGFHTVVSYNMAFHLFMNETPSEWMRRYRSSLI